mmetsp:Transcript_61981/g.139548  ORF Transcript_61981/g.139548 Transcript_61981/m.139548 type:complete len:209 (-) Transcript_61981:2222-2848(-)
MLRWRLWKPPPQDAPQAAQSPHSDSMQCFGSMGLHIAVSCNVPSQGVPSGVGSWLTARLRYFWPTLPLRAHSDQFSHSPSKQSLLLGLSWPHSLVSTKVPEHGLTHFSSCSAGSRVRSHNLEAAFGADHALHSVNSQSTGVHVWQCSAASHMLRFIWAPMHLAPFSKAKRALSGDWVSVRARLRIDVLVPQLPNSQPKEAVHSVHVQK